MKKKIYIKSLLAAICLIMWTVSLSAQNTTVFQWKGGSGNWSDPSHWTNNGTAKSAIPSEKDQVFIKADQNPIEIKIGNPIVASAIYTAGSKKISFAADDNATIKLNGSLVLSPLTEISSNLEFQLTGTSESLLYNVPERLQKRIKFNKGSRYLKTGINPKSGGSCPYFTIVPDPVAPTCNGFSNGIASVLEPLDGVGPYTYQWIGGPSTRQWLNLGAGTYTVIVIDIGQGGMPCNIDVFVNEPGPLTVFSMNATPPLCADVCNGTASPIVIGGNGGYSFSWSSGETGSPATQLCPQFNLEITDLKGCVYDTTYTFTNSPDTIKFVADITNVECFGEDDGAIDMTITGGVTPFTSSWTGPNGYSSGSQSIANLEPGDYTLSVVDGNGCAADSTFTISENPLLDAVISTVDNGCANGSEGSVSVVVSGGSGNYNFSWTGPNGFASTDQNISGLVSGTYELTVLDGVLCSFVTQATISEPTAISINFTSTDVLCADGSTGTASASAAGGTPAYTYSWTGPNGFSSNGPSVSNIIAGIYIVSVADGNGCLKIDSLVINQPDPLDLDFAATPITCHNGADGAIELSISGGSNPYTVSWTGPTGFSSTDEDISGLAAGNYSATVTDANSCTTSGSFEITNPASITLTSSITNSTCATGNSGAIDLTVSGGLPPYSYAWTGPGGFSNTNEDISNLATGTYNVTVTDDSGCEILESFEVDAPDALSATFTKVNASCNGANDGSIITTPSGGTAPYSFLWIGPAGFFSTDQNISNLVGGSYSLQLSDINGCAGFFTVTLSQPSKINIANIVTNVLCFGASTGKVDVTINGGSPGYSYSWTGPNGFTSTQQDINNVPAGVYTLTVTDNIGCSKSRDFNITQPQEIQVTATVQDVVCAGDSNGSISINVSNGIAPFTYAWTGPSGFISADANINSLLPGTYSVTVTDANLCSVTQSFTVNHTVTLEVDPEVADVSCYLANDGSIDITISGGQLPYQVSWSGSNGFSSTEESISDLSAGDYTLTVIDDNGCELSQTFVITQPDELTTNTIKTDILCAGDTNGSLSANVSGGTTPYSISWTGPDGFASANENITDLDAGSYELTVVDAHNCSTSSVIEIDSPDSILVDISINQPSCLLDNGEVVASVTGGVVASDYIYKWTNANGDQIGSLATLSGLAPGTYTLTVSDDNGCSVQTEIVLTRIVFNVAAEIENVTCHGANDGNITVNPTNGTPPFTYIWAGPDGFTSASPVISDLSPGNYTLTVEDGSGCIIDLDYDITQPDEISASVEITPISCLDESNGVITLNPAGGSTPYAITWTGPDGFTSTLFSISDLSAGIYDAEVMDANGCIKDTSVVLDPGFDFSLTLNPTDPACADGGNGAVTVDISSTDPLQTNYSFVWEGPEGYTAATRDISNLSPGVYIVSVTSENGCVRQDSTELMNPEPIDITVETSLSSCGQSNGSAAATISGGSAPYDYVWVNNSGDTLSVQDSLLNVPAGFYTLIITDNVGCEIPEMFTISDDSGDLEFAANAPTCYGGTDGTIDITVSGAAQPVTYQWSDGNSVISTDEDLVNVGAGTYMVLASGFNGCTFSASIELFNPQQITATANVTDVSCNGVDGKIDLLINGAVNPYQVTWTGANGYAATGSSITGLEGGMYYFTISDSRGCAITDSANVGFAATMVVDPVVSNIICGGDSTGSIVLNVTGGILPYDFQWTGESGFSASTKDIDNLIAGDYAVTITDAMGCDLSTEFTITQNEPIAATFTIGNPDCNADNGSISVSLSGGSVADQYFIQWSDQDGNAYPNTPDLSDLSVGIYNFTASDDLGCAFDTSIVLTNATATIIIAKTNLICAGENSGSIDLTVTDVAEPFTTTWSGPNGYSETGTSLLDLEAGDYTYTIVGSDGCTSTGIVEITSPEPISATAEISNTCFGESSGAIDITISGGIADYSVAWSGPDGFTSTDMDLVDLKAGQYIVSISDQNGCDYTATFDILENPEIQLTASVNDVHCNGLADGEINLVVNGGLAPYQILWTGTDGFTSEEDSISSLSSGDYMVSVTDDSGCSIDSVFTVSEPDSLTIVENVISAGCNSPDSPGSIEIVVTGGSPDYSIAWSGPDGFAENTFLIENLEPGIYDYTITDAALCQEEGSIEILEVTPLNTELTGTNISCKGGTNGSINTIVTGGLAPYVYNWSGPRSFDSSDSVLTDLNAGTYIVLITDSAGCSSGGMLEITEPDSLFIDLSNTVDANCNSSHDGSILPEISGGTSPYDFAWSGPDGFESTEKDITELYPGAYTLTVIDSNGCSNSSEADITYIFEISANAGADQAVCQSDLPLLLQGSGANVEMFFWTNMEGDTLTSDSSLYLTDLPGTYSYILIAGNGLCSISDTVNVEILNNPDADAGPDKQVFAEEVFTLGGNPTSSTAVTYLWSPNPNNGFNTSLANPSGSILESTTFIVFVKDNKGCVGTDTTFVEVLPEVIVTSGFTPNGDGINDTWVIDNMELFPNNTVQIFNRWGIVLYSQKGYSGQNAWDGFYEGKPVPVGTYYYAIDLHDARFPEPMTGPLTIYR